MLHSKNVCVCFLVKLRWCSLGLSTFNPYLYAPTNHITSIVLIQCVFSLPPGLVMGGQAGLPRSFFPAFLSTQLMIEELLREHTPCN